MSFFDQVNIAYNKGIESRISEEGLSTIKAKARARVNNDIVKNLQEKDVEEISL